MPPGKACTGGYMKGVSSVARGQEIICRGFVPDGNGGYKPVESLSPEEKAACSRWLVERLGRAEEEYFSLHPDIYAKF